MKVDDGEAVEAVVLAVDASVVWVAGVVNEALLVDEDNGKDVELVSGIATGVEES